MGKIIYNKFDKKLITKLPRVTFEGTTIVVVSNFEAHKAVDFLLKQTLLGIDTETRPSFKKISCRFCRWPRKISVSSSGSTISAFPMISEGSSKTPRCRRWGSPCTTMCSRFTKKAISPPDCSSTCKTT